MASPEPPLRERQPVRQMESLSWSRSCRSPSRTRSTLRCRPSVHALVADHALRRRRLPSWLRLFSFPSPPYLPQRECPDGHRSTSRAQIRQEGPLRGPSAHTVPDAFRDVRGLRCRGRCLRRAVPWPALIQREAPRRRGGSRKPQPCDRVASAGACVSLVSRERRRFRETTHNCVPRSDCTARITSARDFRAFACGSSRRGQVRRSLGYSYETCRHVAHPQARDRPSRGCLRTPCR